MFDTYFKFVWKLLRRMGLSGSAADDATQEVFVVAARRLECVEEGKERAYLVGTALRVASQWRRTVRRRREDPEPAAGFDETEVSGLPPDDLADLRKARSLLDQILASMPSDLRAAFVLYEFEGFTFAEIAEATNTPLGTAKSRLRLARQHFDAHANSLRHQLEAGGRS